MGNQYIFKRVETKYLMNKHQKEAFEYLTQNYIHADKYGLDSIRNIYYDTKDYEIIRTSIEKPAYKEKLRMRGYGQIGPESTIYLELKKKYLSLLS